MLQRNIEHLASQKGLIAGDKCLDITYTVTESSRVNPEDPSVGILSIKDVRTDIGMAGNYAKLLSSVFYAELIDLDTQNPVKFLNTKRHRIYLDSNPPKYIKRLDSDEPQVPLTYTPGAFRPDYAVVADYCKGSITPELVNLIKLDVKDTYVDTKTTDPRAYESYAGCIVKLNEVEFEHSKEYHHLFKLIVHTKGANGAELVYPSDHTKDYSVSGIPGNPVSVSGAGDVFFGYFIGFRQILGFTDYEALTLANKAASISVKYTYPYLPQIYEIRN